MPQTVYPRSCLRVAFVYRPSVDCTKINNPEAKGVAHKDCTKAGRHQMRRIAYNLAEFMSRPSPSHHGNKPTHFNPIVWMSDEEAKSMAGVRAIQEVQDVDFGAFKGLEDLKKFTPKEHTDGSLIVNRVAVLCQAGCMWPTIQTLAGMKADIFAPNTASVSMFDVFADGSNPVLHCIGNTELAPNVEWCYNGVKKENTDIIETSGVTKTSEEKKSEVDEAVVNAVTKAIEQAFSTIEEEESEVDEAVVNAVTKAIEQAFSTIVEEESEVAEVGVEQTLNSEDEQH